MTRHEVLPNGVRLLVRELRTAPVVALNLWVGSGSSDDPEELSGTAHFIEHMLFRIGRGAGARDLAQVVHDAGGRLNAETGCDHTMYHQVVPSARWKDVLGPSVEAVRDPALRPEDVDSERGIVMEEARSRESDPAAFVWRRLMETAFGERPCGRPVVGTPDSVARITADTLREHHFGHYRGTNLVQVIVGDVDADEAIEFAAAGLSGFPAGEVAHRGATGERDDHELTAVAYAGRVDQPYVALAFDGPDALHDDVPALDALCGLLGVGRSSRLFKSLRTSEGIVSDISCGLVAFRSSGLVAVRCVATIPDAERVAGAIFREAERLRREPPRGPEMEKNLRRLESAYVLEHETAESIAGMMGYFETLGDYRWSEEYVDRLARVGADDVVRVARKYMDPERASVVFYLPGERSTEPIDRSDSLRAGIADALGSLPAAIGEGRAAWSPPPSLERPAFLRERARNAHTRITLDGGETVVTCETPGLPIVSMSVGFEGGFLEEPPDKSGLTYAAEKMAVLGTSAMTAAEIQEKIEGLGSGLATAVERDGFGMGFTVLSKHLREAVEIAAEILTEAAFPGSMLSPVKSQVLSEIIETQDSPFRRAILELLPLAFPGSPYGRPIRGTPDTVRSFSATEIEAWHRGICLRDRMSACLVGDVTADVAREAISEVFAGLPRSPGTGSGPGAAGRGGFPDSGVPPGLRPGGESVIELPESPQSVIAVAVPAPTGGTREATAARVLVQALAMMGGRLWRNLRERPPHAYRVGATLLAYAGAGATIAYATSAPGEEEAVVDGLREELARVSRHGLERDELERTRAHLAGSLDISLVRGAARSSSYTMAEVMGFGYEHVKDLAESVRSVTADDVANVARDYLDPEPDFARVILKGKTP
ncbi:MAG: hypothetical protein GF400_02520 [Candidatus Eisenbacteria bacterium]|nr:hypothetical protein [Candidatus Eisenbacteria bacterium]